MAEEPRSIRLAPSQLSLFWWYLLGVLLIPLLGIGLIVIYRTYSSIRDVEYIITDRTIESKDSKVSEKIDLANIRSAKVRQRWIDKKLGLGDLILKTESRTVTLLGQEDPERLSEMIRQAVESERERIESLKKKPKPKVDSKPGRSDRIDYLTGLWQQGLLSDEDFKKERKHFE